MQYISLSNRSLSYFTTKSQLSELGGSSTYQVYDSQIDMRPKPKKNGIENKTALQDFLESNTTDNLAESLVDRVKQMYFAQLSLVCRHKFTSEVENDRLEVLESVISKAYSFSNLFAVEDSLVNKNLMQCESRYQKTLKCKSTEYTLNKTKVRQKMNALFNLKCSSKFIAFYSISFPIGTSDDECFQCWNYYLTTLRKKFDLTNYIWVSERQKNDTLHYHMLTNNYMPILQINRVMAIIINNRVLAGSMSWGSSSLDRYNGVDVDSVYNSKRHKKTGRVFNNTQLRYWISCYITKYVVKNVDKFQHLCWHCSRSVSQLFTTTLLPLEQSFIVTSHLPSLRDLYIHLVSDFNSTWIFKFEPPPIIFEKIRLFNDIIFKEFEPLPIKRINIINFKTSTL